jgi:hypothetical protein
MAGEVALQALVKVASEVAESRQTIVLSQPDAPPSPNPSPASGRGVLTLSHFFANESAMRTIVGALRKRYT